MKHSSEINKIRSAEAVAWELALSFEKSCKPEESSSEFVYRLRDMLSSVIHKDRHDIIAASRADIQRDGVKFAIERLRDLRESDMGKWSHSRDLKFAPVELSDYVLIEWRQYELSNMQRG